MSRTPRDRLRAASVALFALVNLAAVALAPVDMQTVLLICALFAVGAAVQGAVVDRGNLAAAVFLSVPPMAALVSAEASTWPLPFLAALLLTASELNVLSWECDGVSPVGDALRQRVRQILQLSVAGLAASLFILIISTGPSPRGMAAVLIAASALVALGRVLFRSSGRRECHTASDGRVDLMRPSAPRSPATAVGVLPRPPGSAAPAPRTRNAR